MWRDIYMLKREMLFHLGVYITFISYLKKEEEQLKKLRLSKDMCVIKVRYSVSELLYSF